MQATNLWVLHLTQEWEHCWPEQTGRQQWGDYLVLVFITEAAHLVLAAVPPVHPVGVRLALLRHGGHTEKLSPQ